MCFLRVAALAGVFLLTACGSALWVETEPPRTRVVEKASHRHGKVVPRRLHAKDRRLYRTYYTGNVYYRPHHHHHSTYRFPVFVEGVAVYQPYSYCSDRLFLSAEVHLPRLAIGVDIHRGNIVYEEHHHGDDDDDDDDYHEDDDDDHHHDDDDDDD